MGSAPSCSQLVFTGNFTSRIYDSFMVYGSFSFKTLDDTHAVLKLQYLGAFRKGSKYVIPMTYERLYNNARVSILATTTLHSVKSQKEFPQQFAIHIMDTRIGYLNTLSPIDSCQLYINSKEEHPVEDLDDDRVNPRF